MNKEARRKQSAEDKAFHSENRNHNLTLAHGVFVHSLFYWLGIARPSHKIKNQNKSSHTPNVKR